MDDIEESGIPTPQSEEQLSPTKTPAETSAKTPAETAEKTAEEEVDFEFNTDIDDVDLLDTNINSVIIEDVERVAEHERIHTDDLMFEKYLEEAFLSQYPVSKQNSKYVQDNVYQKVRRMLDIKHRAAEIIKQPKNYSSLQNDITTGNFTQPWIIPIVLDKQKYFINEEDIPDLDSDEIIAKFVGKHRDPKGYKLFDFKKRYQKEQNYINSFIKDKIDFDKFNRITYSLANPYINTENIPDYPGYVQKMRHRTNLLRYYDKDTVFWQNRNGLGPINTYYELIDDTTKQTVQKTKVLVPPEEINIVGMLIIPPHKPTLNANVKGDIHFENYGEYTTVTSITQHDTNSTKVTFKDPIKDLTNNIQLLIEDTNSEPTINGRYTKFTILDDDPKSIIINRKLIKSGNKGRVFSVLPLETTSIPITLNKNEVKTSQPNLNQATVYMFTKLNKLEQDTYTKVIEAIVPSIETILKNEKENIIKASTSLDQIDKILSKYMLQFNTLKITELTPIKAIIKEQINTLTANTPADIQDALSNVIKLRKQQLEKHQELLKKRLKNTNHLYSDEFITAKEITTYYGDYPHLMTIIDSEQTRADWINNQPDNGYLYYTFVAYKFKQQSQDRLTSTNKEAIRKELTEKKAEHKSLQKKYDQERTKKSFIDIDQTCQRYKFQFESIKDMEVDEKNYKKEQEALQDPSLDPELTPSKIKSHNPGDLAIINSYEEVIDDNTGDNTGKIFEWKNNTWQFLKQAEIHTASDLCDITALNDINTLTLNDLQCMYDSKLGCHSRTFLRYEERINSLTTDITTLEDQLNNADNTLKHTKSLFDNATDRVKMYTPNEEKRLGTSQFEAVPGSSFTDIDAFAPPVSSPSYDQTTTNNTDDRAPADKELQGATEIKIFRHIGKLKNEDYKYYLIFKLIQKDGLQIGKYIYSKKYKVPLLCGHWNYLLRMSNANDDKTKHRLSQELIAKYGDSALIEHGYYSCTVCAERLKTVELDASEGLSRQGDIKHSREVMKAKEQQVKYVTSEELVAQKEMKALENFIECDSVEFRRILHKKGVNIETMKDSYDICRTLNNLSKKLGIKLRGQDTIDIITDILSTYKHPVSYSTIKKRHIQDLETKSVSQDKIDILNDRGFFKDRYEQYMNEYNNQLNYKIATKFLIKLQTTIKPYTYKVYQTQCVFSGLDGTKGVDFLACVLRELNLITTLTFDQKRKKRIRPIYEDKIIDTLTKHYNKELENPKTKELYNKKASNTANSPANSTTSVKDFKNKRTTEYIYKDKDLKDNKTSQIFTKDYVTRVEQASTANEYDVLYNQLVRRQLYLALKMQNIIKDIVSNSETNETELIMNTCCEESVPNYKGYANYFDERTEPKNLLSNLMKESQELIDNFELFTHRGSTTLAVIPPSRIVYTDNVWMRLSESTEKRIHKMLFETYCSVGLTKGEHHRFVAQKNRKQCVKCKQYLKDIKENSYNEDEYKSLIDEIIKHSVKYYTTPTETAIINVKEILEDYHSNFEDLIYNFITKYTKLLGKQTDTEFKKQIKNFLENLGENKQKLEQAGDDIEKKRRYYSRVTTNIKRYYNNYLKKYVSVIANGYDKTAYKIAIQEIDSETAKELQKFIYDFETKFSTFMDNRKAFKQIHFLYSTSDISNIIATSNVYNCKYDEIIKPSSFNFEESTYVMKFIFVKQLDYMLRQRSDKKLVSNDYVAIANYIKHIMQLINDDIAIAKIPDQDIQKIKNRIMYNEMIRRVNEFESLTSSDKKLIKVKASAADTDIFTVDDLQQAESYDDLVYKRQEHGEVIKNMARERLQDEDGRVNENAVEEFFERFEFDERVSQDVYNDAFDLTQPNENIEILEMGDDYGEIPQGDDDDEPLDDAQMLEQLGEGAHDI